MLTAWNAVSTLDRMFDDVMGSSFGAATSARSFEPAIDVRASESEVVFLCDVPGVREDELEVTLEAHVLTIKGARKFEGRSNEQVMLGRSYGTFRRAFTLPDSLDEEKLAANLAHGVLTVRIPKLPRAKPRRIPIEGGGAARQLEETANGRTNG
jgi:HSP20 family protein